MAGFARLATLAALASLAGASDTLAPDEASEGFRLIFDGRSLGAWKASKDNWDIAERALHLRHKGGSIYWSERKLPDDFELRFEWMVGPEGNSGVHYRGGSFEYQVLDNRAQPRYKPEVTAGSIYNLVGPARDITRSPMQWNEGRILCRGTVIRHWLNGQLVAELDTAAPESAKPLEKERQRRIQVPAPGPAREGWLTLSDHTGTVYFRNIRLKLSR